ncbi:uncharacterized protein K452DRAFT_327339 [Aplosporella prunicola CBS 121167]|uniref:Uncharacterized protein n=1 Tax=Aplosporella prunicola CBS 121167 TaxID=1176127 RepID=A0A6A6BCQ8_9PEZI|nr:uncharacterized protein K452DRAFT_327339 [Aplosporella prunicola CBS 121167]KAF2141143.1 hypothetical protein K452DRAFT_327339 [Aplosporella prunicola CBS 121167]
MIEDLTPAIVEILGSVLQLDPLFFASHLQPPWPDISVQTPDMAMLPSRLRVDKYINIHYHRTVVFNDPEIPQKQLLRPSNVYRKVVVLPKTKGFHIGLAQHCCSIYKTTLPNQEWIGIVLVDPPISSIYYSVKDKKKDVLLFNFGSKPFLGGYEDFQNAELSYKSEVTCGPKRSGLIEDLVYYWKRQKPLFFEPKSPILLHLAYFPLRIVAAEWVNYLTVMHHSIKEYEYKIGGLSDMPQELERLSSDLQTLQSWRRRSMSSEQKLRATARFIRDSYDTKQRNSSWETIAEDYDHLATRVVSFGQLYENMLPIATSMVQIADSRQSFAETANVTRLTYLALIFVPFTFTTGLFSMNNNTAPGSSGFWLFFVVAIPMTLLVFIVARPPIREARIIKEYVGNFNIPRFRQFG